MSSDSENTPGANPLLEAEGLQYRPTAADRLWLLRAVAREGAPHETVARALVNGFFVRLRNEPALTLAESVRGYAQPVNPRWFPPRWQDGVLVEGDLLQRHFVAHPELDERERSAELRKAMLRRDVFSKASKFAPDVVQAVNVALRTAYPSDVTDYAAAWVDAGLKGMVERPQPAAAQGDNRFWTRLGGWPGYRVA